MQGEKIGSNTQEWYCSMFCKESGCESEFWVPVLTQHSLVVTASYFPILTFLVYKIGVKRLICLDGSESLLE